MQITRSLFIFLFIPLLTFSQRSEWVTNQSIDSGSENRLNGMVTDNVGNVYVTGTKRTLTNDADIFICKYDPSGQLLWQKIISSSGEELSQAICLDQQGNIYITGGFTSDAIDFDPGPSQHFIYGPGNCYYGSSHSYFLAKFNNNGNFIWVRNSGSCHGSGFCGSDVSGRAVTVDHSGNVLVSGYFSYDLSFGSDTIFANACGTDIFVAKFNNNGVNIFAFGIGSSSSSATIETADAIKVDPQNNIYITGNIFGAVDFDPSPDTVLFEGSLYLAKYSPSGNFIWAKVPPTYTGIGTSIAIDDSSNVYLSSWYRSYTIVITDIENDTLETGPGSDDGLIEKFNSDGELIWHKNISSLNVQTANSYFYPKSIQLDNNLDLQIVGTVTGTVDIDPGPDTNFVFGNYSTCWIKLNYNGEYEKSFVLNEQSSVCFSTELSILNDSDFYIGGFFWDPVDFAPGCPENIKHATESDNIFIAKYLQSSLPKIQTDTLAQVICSDDLLNIIFSIEGVFNSGNYFIAQLSDPFGHFENPITLDSIASVESGNINCHLPDSILPPGNYRIRVIGTNPIVFGCDNSNDIIFTQRTNLFIDEDNDSYTSGDTTLCFYGSVPTGFSTYSSGIDCDDHDNSIFQIVSLYKDLDQDGYDDGKDSLCIGASIPAGYSYYSSGADCNDLDNSNFQNVTLFIDADHDGYDAGTEQLCIGGNIPSGYSYFTYGNDCNDTNYSINPGAFEITCNGIDENCNGNADECPTINLSFKVFIQGYYNIATGTMNNSGQGGCLFLTANSSDPNDVDSIFFSILDQNTLAELFTTFGILKQDGSVNIEINSLNPNYYYLEIKHRNSISICTAYPIYFYNNSFFDFSINPSQIYESNLALINSSPEIWGLYSGDIADISIDSFNQDGVIESFDYSFLESSITNLEDIYSAADLTGDGKVDDADLLIIESNLPLFIRSSKP